LVHDAAAEHCCIIPSNDIAAHQICPTANPQGNAVLTAISPQGNAVLTAISPFIEEHQQSMCIFIVASSMDQEHHMDHMTTFHHLHPHLLKCWRWGGVWDEFSQLGGVIKGVLQHVRVTDAAATAGSTSVHSDPGI
jgi:hypothetical protein